MTITPLLLPVGAAAAAFGVSETALRRSIECGMPTCRTHYGSQLMVPMAAAHDWFCAGGAMAIEPAEPATQIA